MAYSVTEIRDDDNEEENLPGLIISFNLTSEYCVEDIASAIPNDSDFKALHIL